MAQKNNNNDGNWFAVRFASVQNWIPSMIDNMSLNLILIGVIAALGIGFWFQFIPGVWAVIGSMAIIGVRWYLYYLGKKKETKAFQTRFNLVSFIVTAIASILGIGLVLSVVYDTGFFNLIATEWETQFMWLVALIYICYACIAIMEFYSHWFIQKLQSKAVLDLIYLLIPLVVVVMLVFNLMPTASLPGTFYWIFTIIGGGFFVAWGVWKWNWHKVDWESDKKSYFIYGAYLVGSLAGMGVMFYLFGFLSPTGGHFAGEIPLINGQAAPVNYFSYIFYIFFQSPVAAIMIAIMTFGTIVNIFAATAPGKSVKGGAVIGIVITVIPPMIIVLEIMSGGIPPPDLLSDILGTGVASFIFSLAETGVFIIVAIILSVFSGVADMMQGNNED